MKKRILVFSVALNSYQWIYKRCLDSHKQYAKHYDYDYQSVTRPLATELGVECCWLKLTLMLQALHAGYDEVLYVDADAFIQSRAPALDTLVKKGKYLYMAQSYSARFNSGVIFVRNNPAVRAWLSNVIASKDKPVHAVNDVGWGENGHIIEHAMGCNFISPLHLRWNNTYKPDLNDYIRHFSFGPMRNSQPLNLYHKVLSRLTKVLAKLRTFASVLCLRVKTNDSLQTLTNKVIEYYPLFRPRI